MKFTNTLFSLASLAATATANVNLAKDQHHFASGTLGPAMWLFGAEGMRIYSPDGSSELKSAGATEICHNVTGYKGSAPSFSCSFYDIVSDGKKYVWGAVSRGVSKIDVFDIDTGATVGSFETCMTPRDLEYHPLRDEIWVRCQDVSDPTQGYMDVFSASSPSADIKTQVMLKSNTTLSSRGYSVIDASLGDVGFSTDRDQAKLFKIDLSERVVLDAFDIPLAHGAYEVAYSQVNKHIFVRATVCCSCGFEGADLGADCGRYGSDLVDITTGPSAGTTQNGQCGRCDGLAGVDTLGVYEFDTQTETIIGNHLMKEGVGGDPFPSPDGEHIVLVGRNGAETVRILKTGVNGQKSTIAFDLELKFDTTGVEDSAVINDFAFIKNDKYSMVVFASGSSNKIALIDLSSGSPSISYVSFGGEELSADRNRRQVEWVAGTDYVWVDGKALGETYVIDISAKSVVNTITGFELSKMVFVENFERKRTSQLIAQMTRDASTADFKSFAAANSNTPAVDGDAIDPVGVAALVIGLVALIVGVLNLVKMSQRNSASPGVVQHEASGKNLHDEEFSLGSKREQVATA